MSFVTVEFAIFFAIIIPVYFVTPQRFRWALLLTASYAFYGFWSIYYLPLIIFSTLVDYGVGRWLENTPSEHKRRRTALLLTSITVNLGILFIFKYFNFFSESIGAIYRLFDPTYNPVLLSVLLPVGISFYTFQSMAYTIDVYRERIPAEHHFGIFATYIAFFPQLVAGPIERAQNMLPQFRQEMSFDVERIVSGLQLIMWGLFMKIVVADHLALYVNTVFEDIYAYSGPTITIATMLFYFQIYCDFAAYSKIAIGIARMMGYDLMTNFRQPMLARTHNEFWQRWHISLMTWFQDYIFYPLGGSRRPLPRVLLNIMAVFLISGIWHGAGWNFVIWGVASGAVVAGQFLFRAKRFRLMPRWLPKQYHAPVQILLTNLTLQPLILCFRAPDLESLLFGVSHIYTLSDGLGVLSPANIGVLSPGWELTTMIASCVFLFTVDWLHEKYDIIGNLHNVQPVIRYAAIYGIGSLLLVFMFTYATTTAPDFIYFQF